MLKVMAVIHQKLVKVLGVAVRIQTARGHLQTSESESEREPEFSSCSRCIG